MPDWNKILEQIKEVLGKLDTKMKIILGSVLVVFIIALMMIGSVSSDQGKVALFGRKIKNSEFSLLQPSA